VERVLEFVKIYADFNIICLIDIGITISMPSMAGRNTIFSALIFCDPDPALLRDQDMLFYQEKSCDEGYMKKKTPHSQQIIILVEDT
jgi:hypothetical protein